MLSLVTREKRPNPPAPASFSKISISCSCCPALKICYRKRNEPHLTHKSHNQENKTYSYKIQALPLMFISFKILKKIPEPMTHKAQDYLREGNSVKFGFCIHYPSEGWKIDGILFAPTNKTQNARKGSPTNPSAHGLCLGQLQP